MDLDHVALATRDVAPALDVLVGELGGIVLFGGQGPGFRPVQVRLGDAVDGMTIELLEPWAVEVDDFLDRFLERQGEGPHHLTFKVDDLEAALERTRGAGYHPVGIDVSDPGWKEAFLHPREAQGTVVQLAESHGDFPTRERLLEHVREHGPDGHPRWWPEPPPSVTREAARLERVVFAAPSLGTSLGLFAGLLGGEEADAGEGWVELEWPGGARLRLEERPALATPGIDWLEVLTDGPPAEREVAGTRVLLMPDQSR